MPVTLASASILARGWGLGQLADRLVEMADLAAGNVAEIWGLLILQRAGSGSSAQIAAMSGRRPLVKGCLGAVVNVSGAVMSTAC